MFINSYLNMQFMHSKLYKTFNVWHLVVKLNFDVFGIIKWVHTVVIGVEFLV